jgi:hypothetical protein
MAYGGKSLRLRQHIGWLLMFADSELVRHCCGSSSGATSCSSDGAARPVGLLPFANLKGVLVAARETTWWRLVYWPIPRAFTSALREKQKRAAARSRSCPSSIASAC